MLPIDNEAVYPFPLPSSLAFFLLIPVLHQRKPLRKEENGTSRAEYAMTASQNNKTVDVNNAVV